MPKLFVYLDEYKMYSISSQIFEGLTREVVQYSESVKAEKEEQKGPVGSGRLLADIITTQQGRQESKFLHDYAYTLFEKRLLDDGKVIEVRPGTNAGHPGALGSLSFIKVTGPLAFNDIGAIRRLSGNFNRFLSALRYVTGHQLRDALATLWKLELEQAKGQQRSDIQRKLKELYQPKDETTLDPKYLKELDYLLDFGYGDHLEAQISAEYADERLLFTAILDKDSLREKQEVLAKKYSRRAEKPFTIFGVVTQSGAESVAGAQAIGEDSGTTGSAHAEPNDVSSAPADATPAPEHLRLALQEMVTHLTNVENSFVGRLPNEVTIDPIAVYREL